MCVYTYIYIYIYIHTHIHTHTYLPPAALTDTAVASQNLSPSVSLFSTVATTTNNN